MSDLINCLQVRSGDLIKLILSAATTALSESLQAVNMEVMDNSLCRIIYGTFLNVTESVLCAQGTFSPSAGTCLGDSGGPLVIYENNVPTLIGVATFVSPIGCDSVDPSGFARVSKFLTWINAVTGIALRA